MNVVFDIGNVIVRWSPPEIIRRAMPRHEAPADFAQRFFAHGVWKELNRGLLTEQEARQRYRDELELGEDDVERIFFHVKDSQDLVPGTTDLLARLDAAGLPLYALTDNVREIMAHLERRYDFWPLFRGVVVSAAVQALKPEPEIFRRLLDDHGLRAEETVFIDDVARNVEGAQAVGIRGLQFVSADRCEADLRALGLDFPRATDPAQESRPPLR